MSTTENPQHPVTLSPCDPVPPEKKPTLRRSLSLVQLKLIHDQTRNQHLRRLYMAEPCRRWIAAVYQVAALSLDDTILEADRILRKASFLPANTRHLVMAKFDALILSGDIAIKPDPPDHEE